MRGSSGSCWPAWSNASRLPKILYAVCSFIHEEGEAVVEKVAAARGLQATAIQPLLEKYGFRIRQAKYGCYLFPSDLNNDLFYISLLEPK